ncbi:DUF2157 domain-containing protein [Allobacillus sp. GCM10007491]|uniref:DUF2157 domain-containing protein n=1 Tax=Allobacillus saliphilus TaxID=2912308 RepID=A0A941HT94_9BACI|nr:DUF2157 domain-containing protein [Allobacillus saliphilus]MBR7554591.1 DUF2157 domain-containing protein [Allobacillus saliphilus]
MKNQWLEKESKRWVEEEVIDSQQRKAILNLYPAKNNTSIFFTFAFMLFSLAVLTFLASNWTDIYPLIRTTLLLGFLIVFYYLGTRWIEDGKRLIGEVSYLIALLLFGFSIFLIGEMYHYHFNSIFAFLVWSFVALLLYLSYSSRWIWAAGVLIIVVGQMVNLFGLREFSWILFILFVLAYGLILYARNIRWMAIVYSIAFFIQILGLSAEKLSLVWVTFFLISLYFIGKLIGSTEVGKVLHSLAPVYMFLFVVFHVLFISGDFQFYEELNVVYFVVHIFLMSLIILYLYMKKEIFSIVQLVIFIPTFVIPEASDYVASVALFIFSVSHLMEGFKFKNQRHMNFGTATFLISTFVVYSKVAWGYLSQSLFFLVAGVILFVIGYLLNRQQKMYIEEGGERNDS